MLALAAARSRASTVHGPSMNPSHQELPAVETLQSAMNLRKFRIHVPTSQIQDLQQRLRATRLPSSIDEASWDDGTSLEFIRRLNDYWLHHFDWREQEERLNQLPNFVANVAGLNIHFIHQPGSGPAPLPLVLTHGWPGSFVEMERIIPLLADPAAHGGDPADAFHVVVPSLPGFGFSQAPDRPGMSARTVAELWSKLMSGLGYPRFAAQGGDIGAGVSTWLARLYPDQVLGFHLNYIPGSYRPPADSDRPPSAEEQAFLDRAAAFSAREGAYASLQGTKPLTLSYGLTDSPIALAAWITEKFHAWSDNGGELEAVFGLDEMLTNVSLYWFGNTLEASLRIYKENRQNPLAFALGEKVLPPMGVALFPRELPMPPRSWAERVFDVQRWTAMPEGGHFAALEQPELLAQDIREFFRPLRQRA